MSEKLLDGGFRNLTMGLAGLVATVLLAIVITVFSGAREAIADFGAGFLTSSDWDPVNEKYGAFTAIYGTLVSSLLALLLAVPLGIGTAIFITEDIIPSSLREAIGLMVELLAAIPSVVLGLWAIFVMEPAIRPLLNLSHKLLGWTPLFNTVPQGPGMAPAILILVVMVLPIITAIARDALNQVPIELRQGAYGIGTTRWGAIFNIILPAAISAIVGGVMLKRGWMMRYMPEIARGLMPDLIVAFGYAWAGLMFASAALNVVLALSSGVVRRYLLERGALPAKSMTAAVPISLRASPDASNPGSHSIRFHIQPEGQVARARIEGSTFIVPR
jgi:phosphate transport system permease protein